MSDVTVRPRHMREMQLCAKGCRAFFAREGLSWSDFATQGIPAATLEATGNAYALRAAALARAEVISGEPGHE